MTIPKLSSPIYCHCGRRFKMAPIAEPKNLNNWTEAIERALGIKAIHPSLPAHHRLWLCSPCRQIVSTKAKDLARLLGISDDQVGWIMGKPLLLEEYLTVGQISAL